MWLSNDTEQERGGTLDVREEFLEPGIRVSGNAGAEEGSVPWNLWRETAPADAARGARGPARERAHPAGARAPGQTWTPVTIQPPAGQGHWGLTTPVQPLTQEQAARQVPMSPSSSLTRPPQQSWSPEGGKAGKLVGEVTRRLLV